MVTGNPTCELNINIDTAAIADWLFTRAEFDVAIRGVYGRAGLSVALSGLVGLVLVGFVAGWREVDERPYLEPEALTELS